MNNQDWTPEEDEAFNAVEKQSNLGKQILKEMGQPYHFDVSQRNQVLEEAAALCEQMWHKWLNSPEENEPNKPDAEDCYRAIRGLKE
jgi:hypothetical protein